MCTAATHSGWLEIRKRQHLLSFIAIKVAVHSYAKPPKRTTVARTLTYGYNEIHCFIECLNYRTCASLRPPFEM